MINVNALSSTLSAMSLPQLQQYAALHKNDPYVVTMALSIANQKKQAATAQQGMAGQQQMPKVVDKDIAEMAPRAMPMPEDVGIGQLPADNLKGMCGGGIVAFDEGGAVPRYQSRGLVTNESGDFYAEPLTAAEMGNTDPWRGLKSFAQWAGRNVERDPDTGEVVRKTAAPVAPARVDPALQMGYDQAQYPMPTSAAPRQMPPPGPTAPRPPAGPAAVAASAAGIPGLITTAEGIQKALSDAQKGVTPEVPESLRGGIEDIQKTEQEALNRYVQSIRDEQAARQPAMKDFEERLKQREERLGRQERDLGPLAILQAGMAIMGGASPFAAVNVGAGAQVGIERYTKGAEKLEAARDKLDEAYGRIEEIRRNESRMDAKELREALLKAEQPAIEAKKTMFNALHEDFKLKRADASKGVELLIKTQMELYSQAEQTKRAQIAAGANDPLALFRALGRGDKEVAAGLEMATRLKTEPKTEADVKEQWAKSAVLQARYPDVNDFVRMMKGTTALQMGQQLNAADAALVNKYLQPPR